jgi:hypothetical protein
VLAFGGGVDGTLVDLDVLLDVHGVTLGVSFGWVWAWGGGLVLPHTRSAVLLGEWGGAVTKFALRNVNARVEIDLGGGSVTRRVVAVVDAVLDVDLSVGVPLVRFAVAEEGTTGQWLRGTIGIVMDDG